MDAFQSFVLGVLGGGGATYFITWYQARKIEALVPGGLKAWDLYNTKADHASPTGRTVTDEGGL